MKIKISHPVSAKENDKFICFLSLKDDENDSTQKKNTKKRMEKWMAEEEKEEKTLLVFWKIDRKLLENKKGEAFVL